MKDNIGLILEGGGMRGVYTAGVLDFFLDKEIEFKKKAVETISKDDFIREKLFLKKRL